MGGLQGHTLNLCVVPTNTHHTYRHTDTHTRASPGSSVSKESTWNAGDHLQCRKPRFGSGRSPGEGNGNPLQHSCLGNPVDRGAWQATVHRVIRIHGHELVTKPSPSHTLEENTHIFKFIPHAHILLLAPVEMAKLLSTSGLDSPFESEDFTLPYLPVLYPSTHSHTTAFLPKHPLSWATGGAGKAPLLPPPLAGQSTLGPSAGVVLDL